MITITKDAVKKLDKEFVNLIELPETVSKLEIENLKKTMIEFKDKIIFFCGKFDIHLNEQELIVLKNRIEKMI